MSYILTNSQAEDFLADLKKHYKIYAPKRFPKQGRYSDTDMIRYDEIGHFDEIVFDEKSDFPAKEVLNPIQQALFYFTEDEYRESNGSQKPALIFARPCDINAQRIQEQIFDGNGGYTDSYYKRIHDKIKFVMIECDGGDEDCYCVSMGANKTDNYVMAMKAEDGKLFVNVKDKDFNIYLHEAAGSDYEPAFVTENELKVTIPEIPDKEVLNRLKEHPMWREYDKRCISCGSCTVACSTCTCFTTRDIIYTENSEAGERRRCSASCQVAGFDQMAGQREIRSRAGDRMRYKILHKFHDYKARFKDSHMCVGCGRCTSRCPEFISISATVNKVNQAVAEIREDLGR